MNAYHLMKQLKQLEDRFDADVRKILSAYAADTTTAVAAIQKRVTLAKRKYTKRTPVKPARHLTAAQKRQISLRMKRSWRERRAAAGNAK